MSQGNETLDTATMSQGNDTVDTLTMARKEREKNGIWEVELSYNGEADLQRHLNRCEKNPGHEGFIFVDKFNVEHLPPDYQDNDLVEVVKAMSDLTVRVSVTYVSNKRPKTVKREPYLCYKDRGSNLVRLGSGWVDNVKKFKNERKNCDCKECRNSEKPRTNFAHIEIKTAAHVVYDEDEGEHTTCHLFFDSGGTPDPCSGVVKLSGMTGVTSDTSLDWCKMTYVTHDLDIIDKLHDMVDRFDTLQSKINDKMQDLRNVPIIIVSHPHGCSKQVSVGSSSDLPLSELLYTTTTCPGTSGARVWNTHKHPLPTPTNSLMDSWWACHSGSGSGSSFELLRGLNFSLSGIGVTSDTSATIGIGSGIRNVFYIGIGNGIIIGICIGVGLNMFEISTGQHLLEICIGCMPPVSNSIKIDIGNDIAIAIAIGSVIGSAIDSATVSAIDSAIVSAIGRAIGSAIVRAIWYTEGF